MSKRMVRFTVTLTASANRVQDLVAAFRFLMVSTRLDRGCLGCSVWSEPDSSVHYVEEWSTEEAIRRRVGSDSFTSVLALLETVQSRRTCSSTLSPPRAASISLRKSGSSARAEDVTGHAHRPVGSKVRANPWPRCGFALSPPARRPRQPGHTIPYGKSDRLRHSGGIGHRTHPDRRIHGPGDRHMIGRQSARASFS